MALRHDRAVSYRFHGSRVVIAVCLTAGVLCSCDQKVTGDESGAQEADADGRDESDDDEGADSASETGGGTDSESTTGEESRGDEDVTDATSRADETEAGTTGRTTSTSGASEDPETTRTESEASTDGGVDSGDDTETSDPSAETGDTGGPTCPEAEPLMGGMQYCSNIRGNAGGGYGFELWAEGGGNGCMTVHGVDANFSASWNDVEDFLARVGLDFNQTQTHQQIGTFKADFAETKTDEGGLTYIGIYGWTVNPLREFYILEDWGSAEKPGGFSSDGTPRDEVGTLVADGETYDVWKKTRVDKPAITGPSETFDQYFSIRRTARQCGTISISDHFNQWEELGLPLGNLYEVKILLEAQFNSGNIAFTTANVYVE